MIDKPPGLTSHDVVARVRRILGVRQVGHFGTLDPFATGVLPVSVGKATRFAQFYLKSRKSYSGTIRFGHSTDTYDSTGRATSEDQPVTLETATLEKLFQEFTGRLMQTPPPFSAKHVGGVRAYELARQQKPVSLEPVEVEIYALELLGVAGPDVRFAVECSGGTYVRSLAHDFGQRLGSGAYLADLRRTGVAEFKESQAVTLERLAEAAGQKEGRKLPGAAGSAAARFPGADRSRAPGGGRASRTRFRTGTIHADRTGRGALASRRFVEDPQSRAAAHRRGPAR